MYACHCTLLYNMYTYDVLHGPGLLVCYQVVQVYVITIFYDQYMQWKYVQLMGTRTVTYVSTLYVMNKEQ